MDVFNISRFWAQYLEVGPPKRKTSSIDALLTLRRYFLSLIRKDHVVTISDNAHSVQNGKTIPILFLLNQALQKSLQAMDSRHRHSMRHCKQGLMHLK